eukprot:maker-scaffold100_size373717-snap-gene-0.8 protein:Tk05122 transcript:maker-scaffold100_size373717-snap-gene-0.8-mRNA-1 annotation:"hypothetical protein LOTGIDRAFT_169443"
MQANLAPHSVPNFSNPVECHLPKQIDLGIATQWDVSFFRGPSPARTHFPHHHAMSASVVQLLLHRQVGPMSVIVTSRGIWICHGDEYQEDRSCLLATNEENDWVSASISSQSASKTLSSPISAPTSNDILVATLEGVKAYHFDPSNLEMSKTADQAGTILAEHLNDDIEGIATNPSGNYLAISFANCSDIWVLALQHSAGRGLSSIREIHHKYTLDRGKSNVMSPLCMEFITDFHLLVANPTKLITTWKLDEDQGLDGKPFAIPFKSHFMNTAFRCPIVGLGNTNGDVMILELRTDSLILIGSANVGKSMENALKGEEHAASEVPRVVSISKRRQDMANRPEDEVVESNFAEVSHEILDLEHLYLEHYWHNIQCADIEGQEAFQNEGLSLVAMETVQKGSFLLLKPKSNALVPFSRLSGHKGPIRSLHFSHHFHDFLVSSSDDRSVRLWDVKGGKSLCDIKHRIRAGKRESIPIFPDTVVRSQFYYMDTFLLSASANKLFIHGVTLTEEAAKLRASPTTFACEVSHLKTLNLSQCKFITDFTAVNHFYSYLAMCACSDKGLRIMDFNQQAIAWQVLQAHARPMHKVLLPKTGENIFLSVAIADGAKLWDLRTAQCCHRFDWPNAKRTPPGLDWSPCSNFLAFGNEDGSVHVFDSRQLSGYVAKLDPLSAITSGITDIKFHPHKPWHPKPLSLAPYKKRRTPSGQGCYARVETMVETQASFQAHVPLDSSKLSGIQLMDQTRRRKIEHKCLDLKLMLESQGTGPEEIAHKVLSFRSLLTRQSLGDGKKHLSSGGSLGTITPERDLERALDPKDRRRSDSEAGQSSKKNRKKKRRKKDRRKKRRHRSRSSSYSRSRRSNEKRKKKKKHNRYSLTAGSKDEIPVTSDPSLPLGRSPSPKLRRFIPKPSFNAEDDVALEHSFTSDAISDKQIVISSIDDIPTLDDEGNPVARIEAKSSLVDIVKPVEVDDPIEKKAWDSPELPNSNGFPGASGPVARNLKFPKFLPKIIDCSILNNNNGQRKDEAVEEGPRSSVEPLPRITLQKLLGPLQEQQSIQSKPESIRITKSLPLLTIPELLEELLHLEIPHSIQNTITIPAQTHRIAIFQGAAKDHKCTEEAHSIS